MEVINDLKNISKPFRSAVVTIGNFDGVHVGHKALFEKVIRKAETLGGTSVVVTFEPHPIRVLNCHKDFPLITLYEQKVELIGAIGVDELVCIPFTHEFAATPARSFVQSILCDTIGMKAIIVGPDYSFGRKREGNIGLLREMGESSGFEVIVSNWVEQGPRRISSTEIRKLVKAGEVEEAAGLLGRYHQLRGRVIQGRDRGGKVLGFPTANLAISDELCPVEGIYVVTVEHDKRTYGGVANIGYSPTFADGKFSVEVHVLDFRENIYDHSIRVNFVRRLRGEEKFPSPEALAVQIAKDIEKARKILEAI